jgi:hypothetical protein
MRKFLWQSVAIGVVAWLGIFLFSHIHTPKNSPRSVEFNVSAYFVNQGYAGTAALVTCEKSSYTDGGERVWLCWHRDQSGVYKGDFAGCFLPDGNLSTLPNC